MSLDSLNIDQRIDNGKCIVGVEFPYKRREYIKKDINGKRYISVVLVDARNNNLKWKTVPGNHLPNIRNGIPERLPRICNYFFASNPNNDYLHRVLHIISKRLFLKINIDYDIIYTTGPDVFSFITHLTRYF